MHKKSLFIILLCFISGTSFADNRSWMTGSPVAHFTPEDIKIMRATVEETHDNGVDGTRVSWQNSNTGYSGSTPIDTIKRDGQICRQ